MNKVISIKNCARCKGNHERLEIKKLTHPVTQQAVGYDELTLYTHWALCPTNEEPIMVLVLPDPPS